MITDEPRVRRQRRSLSGWGRTCPSVADVVPAGSADQTIAASPAVIARGLGRSYGDAAQSAGGAVLDATSLPRVFELDESSAVLRVDAGISLEDILRRIIPLGFFVPVTPGTSRVTVGGAIASDVHGKNHHKDGSFANHVTELTLLTPTGPRRLRPDDESAPFFWATAGGMGLTGFITEATISLQRVETGLIASDTTREPDLDAVMQRLVDVDRSSGYSVAWVDGLAKGRSFGRGVVNSGDHAPLDAIQPDQRPTARRYDPGVVSLPPLPYPQPPGIAMKAFNELWYRASRPGHRVESITSFFHPLDALANWNLVYGHRGFLQWQFAVPDGNESLIAESLQRLATTDGTRPTLIVLKRFGAAGRGHLSFPIPGWTLAVDLPVNGTALRATLNDLDAKVVAAGGRLYLAKDSRVRRELIPHMYPRLDEWRSLRNELDPDGRFVSDLSRRLHLTIFDQEHVTE